MKKLCIIILILLSSHLFAKEIDIAKFLATYPTINQIQAKLQAHQFSCEELVNGYLNRIKLYNLAQFNNQAPLNAITQINLQALKQAKQLDKQLQSHSKITKPLFCIPVIVKDNIDVKYLRTSSGSLTLLGVYPIKNAKTISNIQKNGGVIIAKSSMDELASGMYGISSLSGRVGNAYNPNHNSGGSSAGSAVSVAAGFAPIAIGSDNSGSIRIPASYNGLYGLRPTYDLISTKGVFPLGNLDGVIGPMANNVVDLAKLLTIMVGHGFDYSKNLDKNSLKGKHFAIVKSVSGKSLWAGMSSATNKKYQGVISNLKHQGVIISQISLPQFDLNRKNNMSGTANDVNNYFKHSISNISKFQDVCYGNTRVYGKQAACLKFINSIKDENSSQYKQVKKMIAKNQAYIVRIMKKQNIDGLIFPSGIHGIPAEKGQELGSNFDLASNSALPEITIPVGRDGGLPIGLEILGKKNAEYDLLNYAYSYQETFYKFVAPKLHKNIKFTNWTMEQLNQLYLLIGQLGYNTIIKKSDENNITPKQEIQVVKEAISLSK